MANFVKKMLVRTKSRSKSPVKYSNNEFKHWAHGNENGHYQMPYFHYNYHRSAFDDNIYGGDVNQSGSSLLTFAPLTVPEVNYLGLGPQYTQSQPSPPNSTPTNEREMALKGGSKNSFLWFLILEIIARSSAKSAPLFLDHRDTLEGITCDFCIKAMQGVVYDIGVFRDKMMQAVESDCSLFFKSKPEHYKKCVELLREEIEHTAQRLQEGLNPNKVCARLRFCEHLMVKNRTPNPLNLLISAI